MNRIANLVKIRTPDEYVIKSNLFIGTTTILYGIVRNDEEKIQWGAMAYIGGFLSVPLFVVYGVAMAGIHTSQWVHTHIKK